MVFYEATGSVFITKEPPKQRFILILFAFIVQQTMAEALKMRVFYLLTELLAHTLCVFRFFSYAGTVSASCFKTFLYGFNYLLIGIQGYCHCNLSLVGVDKFANAVVVTVAYCSSCNRAVFNKHKGGD